MAVGFAFSERLLWVTFVSSAIKTQWGQYFHPALAVCWISAINMVLIKKTAKRLTPNQKIILCLVEKYLLGDTNYPKGSPV